MTKIILINLIVLFQISLFAQFEVNIDKQYAQAFSKLMVQSKDGRVKPLDTLNMDILNKLIQKREFNKQSYNQIILT
ncbi:MAG: hypothetical protein HRT73_08600, partial [Flavobacteriales bacterium]|nr:hypothetical protein [Flavobacteriales bacterium]